MSSNNYPSWVESFDALALAGKSSPTKADAPRPPPIPPQSQPQPSRTTHGRGAFVGGFNPLNSRPYGQHGPLPADRHTGSNPPHGLAMPMPIPNAYGGPPSQPSLTMQYATSAPHDATTFTRPLPPPRLAPPTPPARPQSGPASSQPSSSRHDGPLLGTSSGQTPPRRRAVSVPPSPTSSAGGDGLTQCSGVTKAGKRCTRQVKVGTALSDMDPDAQIERFCHQHTKEILGPTGFYSRKTGRDWIKFEDWIPDYVQLDTQAALRSEMERARSQSDVPGYIYTFEIRDPKTPDIVHLKVGRAVNLVKRIDQWGKQCGSKEQVLRGWWPGTVEDDQTSLMKGRVIAGEKGAWCHRLERLIHLELADLVKYKPYLDPTFPKNKAVPAVGGLSAGKGIDKKRKCPDCGQMHKEIFSFARVRRGHYRDKEWESIVRPVIEKWGAFVEAYV